MQKDIFGYESMAELAKELAKRTGIKKEEAIGQFCFEVLRANICEKSCALKCSLKTGKQTIDRHVTILRSNGKEIPVSVSTSILKNEKGKFVGRVESFRDLSTIEELKKEIKKSYTFESGEEAKKLAKRFDFEEEQPVVDSVYYYYKSAKDPNLTLFIDSVHLNFQLRYNYTENQSILNLGQIASKEEAIENVQNYLEYTNLIDNSILKGKVTTEPLTYDDRLKKMVTATSLSAAHAVKIHYFRNDLEGMPVLPDEYDKSYNYAIYAKTLGVQLENVLEISYTFWPIAENEYGTYPLISGEKAYEALVSGKAEVIKKGNNGNLVNIRKIYLAYYDSSTPQLYLQPIFVFEGDNDFVAYYQAVAPEYTE